MKRILALAMAALALVAVSCGEKKNDPDIDVNADGYFKVEIQTNEQQAAYRIWWEMDDAIKQALPDNADKKVKPTAENIAAAKAACQAVIDSYSQNWNFDPLSIGLYWCQADDSIKKLIQTYKLGEEEAEESLELTAENLKGTWESEVFSDFAQGYQRKYRLAVNGSNYTMWKAYQEYLKVQNDDKGQLYTVGDKYAGTWSVSGKVLTLTPSDWKASHRLVYDDSSTGKFHAEVNPYDIGTMEANPWFELGSSAVTLDPDSWTVISLQANKLKVRINMDTVVLNKK